MADLHDQGQIGLVLGLGSYFNILSISLYEWNYGHCVVSIVSSDSLLTIHAAIPWLSMKHRA
jgi:hypothetical protein